MLGMDRIYRIPQFGERVGRSAHPLRVMDRNGTFPARWTATGRRYHTEADARCQESLSPQETMIEDPMAVVPAFSCRLYGLRAYHKQIRDAVNYG